MITFEEFIKENNNYNKNDYPKNNPLSDKTHQFLIKWTWNTKFFEYYRSHGIQSIDKDIIDELSKYRPEHEVRLYRIINDIHSELKHKNKLKSYCKNIKTALGMMDDVTNYMDVRWFKPNQILVDTTLIPNFNNLDLIEEVIVLTEGHLDTPEKNLFKE
jgi:uncharacterized protein YkvS